MNIIGFLVGRNPSGLLQPVFENGDIAVSDSESSPKPYCQLVNVKTYYCDCFIIKFIFLNYCCNYCFVQQSYRPSILASYTV